jgi:membrane-associated phospholipid phosphatase
MPVTHAGAFRLTTLLWLRIFMHTRIVLMVAALVVSAACADTGPVEPDSATEGRALSSGETTASERWMRATRVIIGRREVGSPVMITRNFALVAVAEYNAATAAGAAAAVAGKKPSEAGAVAGASAAILRALYPAEDSAITAQLASDRTYFSTIAAETAFDFAAGEAAGAQIAAQVLARAATDGSNAVWTGTIPVGPGYWTNAASPAQPVAPLLGQARAWFLTAGNQFRPAAPPVTTSAAFATDIAEVRALTAARTPDQLALAQFWQFASGPSGPIGHFSELAGGLTTVASYNERRSARVYALLHMAMRDATISCWDAKYAYWFIRPFQVDPSITTPVGRPNFPAYPSAHSCISAAAASVLTGLFPASKSTMDAKVSEAGISRIYAGLHFRFDVTAGQEIGVKVAALALTRVPAANTPVPLQ